MRKVNLIDMTELVHLILANLPRKQVVAVDMTVGNGNDTLFLANHYKTVYGFDIQKIAIDKTAELTKELANVVLINDDHYNFDKYLTKVDLFVFNLGWLPNGDKNIRTEAKHTISTLDKCLRALSNDGVICITCYNGDKQQRSETEAIFKWTENQKELITQTIRMSSIASAPLIMISGKKEISLENV